LRFALELKYDRGMVGFFFVARVHEPIESIAAAASAQTLERRLAPLRDAEE
jgi:hypothetical protein